MRVGSACGLLEDGTQGIGGFTEDNYAGAAPGIFECSVQKWVWLGVW